MKKILVAGLPGSGSTLITKNLAKYLSEKLGKKIFIHDISATQKIFNIFCVSKIDKNISITDYEGIDISGANEWPDEKYDFLITDYSIGSEKLDKEILRQYNYSVIIISDDERLELTKSFITENNLSEVKLIANLSSLEDIKKFNLSENKINYISYFHLDPIVHSTGS